MSRFIYRMCLVVVLVIAVAGGVYYYMTFYQKNEAPQKGTFVNKMDDALSETGRQAREAFSYAGDVVRGASDEVEDMAKDAYRQVRGKIKEVSGQA